MKNECQPVAGRGTFPRVLYSLASQDCSERSRVNDHKTLISSKPCHLQLRGGVWGDVREDTWEKGRGAGGGAGGRCWKERGTVKRRDTLERILGRRGRGAVMGGGVH